MSAQQLAEVVRRVTTVFSGWTPESTLDQIRAEWDALFSDYVPVVDATATVVDAGGVRAEWIVAPDARPDRTIFFLHGGGYVLGSVDSHRDICERLSHLAKARVLAVDYRLAPEHPFPTPLDDALTAYRWMLDQDVDPAGLALAGDSAGAGLGLALMTVLRDRALPLPACATLMSPWVDMEVSGGTMASNDAIDPMVRKPMVETMVQLFMGEAGDRRDPRANLLFADLRGLPPMIVHSGTHETLLDDARRVVARLRDAGVPVEYRIWDGQIHVFHIFAARLDEGAEAIEELAHFIRRHIG